MAPPDVLLAFALATAIFAFMPGPAMVYVAAQTMALGRRAGWMATLGVSTGGLFHVLAAAAGLSAMFTYVPQLYAALKIAGAVYLIWLGVSIVRTRIDAAADVPDVHVKRTGRRAFANSVLVEVLNPKTAIFFVAFLPQFVDPAGSLPVWIQFLLLGLVVNVMFGLGDVAAVVGSSLLLGRMQASAFAQRIVRWAGGALLVGLGIRLATDRS